MLNILSIIFGVTGLLVALPGFVPFLGLWLWVAMVLPVIGLGLGVLSRKRSGAKFNLVVLAAIILRLMLGGGLF